MPTQRRISWFVCFVTACVALFTPNAPAYAQMAGSQEGASSMPAAQTGYPPDPPQEINWSASPYTWEGITASFNNAHTQESAALGIELAPLVFPPYESWQVLSSGEKALWLINEERTARGLAPMQGLEQNVNEVAQAYAEWLLANNKFDHRADRRSPWDRMYAKPAINACHDFVAMGETLHFHATTSSTPIPFAIEKSIYVMLYKDAEPEWGHRHTLLWTPYTENGGDPGREGFLGIGHARGPFTSPLNGEFYQNTDMVVMNFFDPCATWEPAPTATAQPTPTPTPSPTSTPSPAPTPTQTPSPEETQPPREQSRTVSGRVIISSGGDSDNSSNTGVAGVTITADNGETTQSDSNGYFTLTALSPRLHVLTIRKAGYTFTPSTIEVDLAAGDLTTLAITALPGPSGASFNYSLSLPMMIRP